MNSNCSNVLDLSNLQEQLKKSLCFKNCIDLSRYSVSNFKSFPRSLQQFFLTVGQKDFGNKIPDFLLFLSLGLSTDIFIRSPWPISHTQTYNIMKRGLWTNDYYSDTLQPNEKMSNLFMSFCTIFSYVILG